MSLLGNYDDVAPDPRDGFIGRSFTDLTDAVRAAAGELAERDLPAERADIELAAGRAMCVRELAYLAVELRERWTAVLMGQGDPVEHQARLDFGDRREEAL